MVTTYGMSEIRPWALIKLMAQAGDVVLRMMARNNISEKLAEDIDKLVKAIIDEALEIGKMHIKNHCVAIDSWMDVLMETETLGSDEFRALLPEFTDILESNRKKIVARDLIGV